MSGSFHLVSLGCAKNTVDSESMASLLTRAGLRATADSTRADVLIVNTCGFIGPAKDESIAELRRLAQSKRQGQLLIAAGCLTQRYGEQVAQQVEGIDGILGTRRWMDIVRVVQQLRSGHPEPLYHLPEQATSVGIDENGVSRTAVQGASAYLKIADGCRRPCAFCAIPLIKGTAVSRPVAAILAEARQLQSQGVREINLIAQDTTDYGRDLGLKEGLAGLLEDLVSVVPGIDWLRVLYAYPGQVSDRLIDVMASHDQILPYLDMPLQHAHPAVLRRMRRPANIDWVYRTVEKLRKSMPELALRTTYIVGYPGETEAEFQALMDFNAELRFDRVGVFTYSFEDGTASAELGDPTPPEIKEARRDRLMTMQQQLSLEKNHSFIGQTLSVLVDGCGDEVTIGRSYRDAPEIDGLVLIEGEVEPGEMVRVRIHGALPYDLTGKIESVKQDKVPS